MKFSNNVHEKGMLIILQHFYDAICIDAAWLSTNYALYKDQWGTGLIDVHFHEYNTFV